MNLVKKWANWLASAWYPVVFVLAGAGFVGLLLWFQLGSLVSGLSEAELAYRESASTLGEITKNPLNAPHKLLTLGLTTFDWISAPARYASAIIGFLIVVGFFFVLRAWYTRRLAVLGTLLLVSSAWFLHAARTGTDAIMYTTLILVAASLVWLQRRGSGTPASAISLLLIIWLLYIPGMIWFVVPLLVWQFGRISRFLQGQNLIVIALVTIVGAGLLSPLAFAFYNSPDLIRLYLGLPETWPAVTDVATNIVRVPIELFFFGPDAPAVWLDRLPLLDWFASVMLIIGVYAYFFKIRLDRTRFIVFVLGAGTLLAGLGGPVNISVLLPFMYLLVAGGIALMLQQWFTVFPHNPFARTLGPALMSVAVLLAAYYNINQYFIAWPNAPETKQSYQLSIDSN